MYALASFKFGFRRSNISKTDKNILCIHQNHMLVEFFQTKLFEFEDVMRDVATLAEDPFTSTEISVREKRNGSWSTVLAIIGKIVCSKKKFKNLPICTNFQIAVEDKKNKNKNKNKNKKKILFFPFWPDV